MGSRKPPHSRANAPTRTDADSPRRSVVQSGSTQEPRSPLPSTASSAKELPAQEAPLAQEKNPPYSPRRTQDSTARTELRFPGHIRLKRRAEFLRVQNTGRKSYSAALLLFTLRNELPHPRFGVTVSRKVDRRAVVRNRLKRRIREALRRGQHEIVAGFDIVVIARQKAVEMSSAELQRALWTMLRNAKMLRSE